MFTDRRTRPISSARIQGCKFHQLSQSQSKPSIWKIVTMSAGLRMLESKPGMA
jgi:hypothetical protein